MLPKIPSLVLAVINILFVFSYLYHLFKYLPFINLNDNTYHITCSVSFLIGFILQVVSKNFVEIDSAIVVIIVIVLTIIMYTVFNFLNLRRKNKSTEKINALISDEISFQEAFKDKNDFLMTIRFGFIHGNMYVFTWQPFLNAIDLWPNDEDIWIQWIRFVIIYPDQGKRLEQIMDKICEKGFKDMTMKYVKSQVKFIQKSRNKYMTPELKQEFKEIDEIVTNIKTVVITYWNQVSGGSINSNSVYNISLKLKKMVDKVNMKYQRLLSYYPNNYSVSLKYSEFMTNILSDPVVGQFWHNRSNVLKNKKQVLTDATREYGFEFFRFIPRSIQTQIHDDESLNELAKPKNHHNPNLPPNSLLIIEDDNDAHNASGSTTISTANNDDKNLAPSHFRNLSLNAKVPFITILVAISIIFFIIGFIFVPFIPPITMIGTFQPYRRQFDVLKSVCNIRISIMKESYFMFFQALRSLNDILGNSFRAYNNTVLNKEIHKLNDNAEHFQKSIGKEIKHGSLSGRYINKTIIEFVVRNSATNTSFLEGLNTIIGHILHHDNPAGIYYNEQWFQFIFNNIDRMEHSLGTLSGLIGEDMNNHRDDSINIISIILYVLIGVEFILMVIFIFYALKIRKNWNYIINTINSIPRVAIQKVIEKYSNDNTIKNSVENHQNFKSEFRYKLSLSQMVSSRDTSGGLPVKSIITIFIIDFVISVVCVIAVVELMNIIKKDLTYVPMQYYTATNGIYAIFKFITVFLIKGYIDYKNAIPAMMNPPQNPIFTSSFGIFNHDYIKNGIEFIAAQMQDTLDEVVFGTNEQAEKGILYSTKEIIKLLEESNGNPYGEGDTIQKLDLTNFPFFASLSLFYESNLNFIEQIMENPQFNCILAVAQKKFDISIIFDAIRLGTYSLVPKFLDVYVSETDNLFNDSIDKTNMILFLLSSGLFVIGLLAIAWLNVMINKVKEIVQFSLSMLSMVDPIYVQEMQNVMNLFYGKTSGNIQANQTLQRTFKEIESHVPECPIELNNQMIITSINSKLIDEWELESEQVIGSHINLILTFNEEKIYNELTKQASGSHSKEPKHFDTMITLNATKKNIHVSFTSYYIPRNKEVKLLLMFGDNLNKNQKSMNIDEMQKENEEMKIQSIPKRIRFKFDLENGKNSFSSSYIIFCAIKITNLNEYLQNHSSKEAQSFIKAFENQIEDICENDHNIDATYLKKVGNLFLIGFNFIHQNTNYYKPAQESYEFVRRIFSFAKSNNYQIKATMTSTKSATSALLANNTLKFDVYSNEIQNIFTLMNNCQQNEVIFPSKMKDFVPPDVANSFEEVEINKFNEEPDWGYKISLEMR